MNERKPLFIVLEGIDGAGKTTQIKRLAESLECEGHTVYVTAEPTDSEIGRKIREVLSGKIRKSPSELAAMYMLDRIEHNIEISKLMNEGVTVISDRYYYSSLAYQGVTCDYNWIKHMNLDCPALRKPDICIFLDITPEESMKRISLRNSENERDIFETLEMMSATRNRFLSVFADLKDSDRISIIDASRDADEVSNSIVAEIKKALI